MSKLTQILEDQHSEARREAGRTIIRKLPHGLRIEMVSVLNDVVLTITRDTTYPSDQEWQTVFHNLPFLAEYKEPLRIHAGPQARYILTATLKLQPASQMKFI